MFTFGVNLSAYDALKTLTQGLTHPNFWTSVHAAEYLIELKAAPQETEAFVQQIELLHGATPIKRIGVWRVRVQQAQAEKNQARFQKYVHRLKAVAFARPAAPDQIHAIETLFKLQAACTTEEQQFLSALLANPQSPPALKLYAAALYGTQTPANFQHLASLWQKYSNHPTWRGILLYILRQYPTLPGPLLLPVKTLYADATIPAENHYAAAIILLKNHRLETNAIPCTPEKLCGDWLRLQMLMNPHSPAFQKALNELSKSSDTEHNLLAAFATLKTSSPNKTLPPEQD